MYSNYKKKINSDDYDFGFPFACVVYTNKCIALNLDEG